MGDRIRIEQGTVADRPQGLDVLLDAHVHELATYPDLMQLSPDWDRYVACEEAGMLITFYAWDGDELVGYACTVITPHMHYSGLVVANNDVLYVLPEHRASRVGLGLMRATTREARLRGARLMFWHAKENTALDTLLRRRSLKVQDTIFSEVL